MSWPSIVRGLQQLHLVPSQHQQLKYQHTSNNEFDTYLTRVNRIDDESENFALWQQLTGGVSRWDTIQQLLLLVDSALHSFIDPITNKFASAAIRIQRLTLCSSVMGLCHANDFDLIKGGDNIDNEPQIAFLQSLVKLAITAESYRPSDRVRDCEFLDRLAAEAVGILFSTDVSFLFAKDSPLHHHGSAARLNQPLPSHELLVQSLDAIESAVARDLPQLQDIKQQISSEQARTLEAVEALGVDVSTAIAPSANDLPQFCEAANVFVGVYEREFEPWAKRVQVPVLSELGAQCACVTQTAQQFRNVTQQFDKCNRAHAQLQQLRSVTLISESTKHQQLQQIEQERIALGVLEDSLRRNPNQRSSTTTNAMW